MEVVTQYLVLYTQRSAHLSLLRRAFQPDSHSHYGCGAGAGSGHNRRGRLGFHFADVGGGYREQRYRIRLPREPRDWQTVAL